MPSFKEYFGCTVFIMMGDGFHPPAQMGRDASCPWGRRQRGRDARIMSVTFADERELVSAQCLGEA